MKEIPLTQGKVALVDDADYERVIKYKWNARRFKYTYYAWHTLGRGGRSIALHRFVMDAKPGEFVDHIDHDGLNCTRANLRICTRTQNARNRKIRIDSRTGYKGVSFSKNSGKWKASISNNNKRLYLGSFSDPLLAARAYDDMARKLFGNFAMTNFTE